MTTGPGRASRIAAARAGQLGQREIIDHYERLIRDLAEPPILIGHSAGGVFVQHLLDRGLGAAGVAIDPAPTPGVPLYPHAIVSALPVFLDPFSWRKVKMMSRRFFQRRFAQTVPRDQADALYDRYIVPTPGKVYWDGVINKIEIDWDNPDRAAAAADRRRQGPDRRRGMTGAIFRKQSRAPSLTELKTLPRSVALDLPRSRLGRGRRLCARLGGAARDQDARQPQPAAD